MQVKSLVKHYNTEFTLNFPAYEFVPGARYAILGANGSGKSTLAKLLAGVLPADDGLLRPGCSVGYMPQKSMGFRLSVEQNLWLAAPKDAGGETRVQTLLDELDLRRLARRDGGRLSGGETARLALARVLARTWDILILDEPTAAMDVSSALLAEDAILRYQQETNCTLLLITHSIAQAGRIAEQALFLHEGLLWEEGPCRELLLHPQRPETERFLHFTAGTR